MKQQNKTKQNMTVKDLIIKLIEIEASLDTEVGIAIKQEDDEEILYVGTKGNIIIKTPSKIGDPNIVWLEGEIKKDSEVIRREGIYAKGKKG